MTTQKINGITGFTPVLAAAEFGPSMLDSDRVGAWVNNKLHPGDAYHCPACGVEITSSRARTTFATGGRVCCLSCKKYFTNRTNTFLHGSCIGSNTIYLLAVLTALQAPRRVIAAIVKLHPDSVRKWQQIFTALETPLV